MFPLFRQWYERYFTDPQILILGVMLVAGSVFVLTLGEMLTPVMIAVIIAYLLDGAVMRLDRIRIPRNAAVILVFCAFMACLMATLFVLLPLISRQIGQLIQDIPSMIAKGQKALLHLPEQYPEIISKTQITRFMDFLTTELTSLGQRLLSLSIESVRGIFSLVIYLILVPLLVFFFLRDKGVILGWFSGFLPKNRELADTVWQEVNLQISNYVRGKIWEILIVWGVTWAAFSLLELRFAMTLSLFVGLSVLIPYIGATLMFLPVAMIAYFQWGLEADFIYTMGALAIIQALDGNLLVPLLLSGVVNLHPVAIIVAVLVFGGLWGIWGLFFAIPLATLVHAVIKAWMGQKARPIPESAP